MASPLPVSPSLEIAVAEELAAAAEVEEADAAYLEIMVGEDDDDRHLRQLQRAYVADLQTNAADAAAAAAEIYSPGERSFRDTPVKFLLSLGWVCHLRMRHILLMSLKVGIIPMIRNLIIGNCTVHNSSIQQQQKVFCC